MRLLVLGGSSEATLLMRALEARRDVESILSLAGRTVTPVLPQGRHRIGGFGGVAGLVACLRDERIDAMVDATHPFAERMSAHAIAAARAGGVALARYTRPPWQAQEGDDWREVASLDAAVDALGGEARRCFLTVGRLGLAAFARAPQHHYLVRSIDPVEPGVLPGAEIVLARPPFTLEGEIALMRAARIDALVTKNSGGAAAAAKLTAARALAIPVVLVAQRAGGGDVTFYALGDALRWIEAHRPPP